MELTLSFKGKVHDACVQEVQRRIEQCEKAMKQYQDAANQETKSSAGDKYETGRAMMMLEKDKAAQQLSEVLKLKKVLDELKVKEIGYVTHGSLAKTKVGLYYFAVSLGLMEIDGQKVFCLSPVSPLGIAMTYKHIGETYEFNGNEFMIEAAI